MSTEQQSSAASGAAAAVASPVKRVGFATNVDVIGVSEPPPDDGMLDRKYDGQVLEQLLKPTYNNDTHKLFSQESKTAPPPPVNFLSNLQSLMGQRAAKAADTAASTSTAARSTTQHDDDDDDDSGEEYVKDESGHWVSKSQLASRQRIEELNRDLVAEK